MSKITPQKQQVSSVQSDFDVKWGKRVFSDVFNVSANEDTICKALDFTYTVKISAFDKSPYSLAILRNTVSSL